MDVSEKQTVARKGYISEELQQQAKKAVPVSPVISEFLVAARKGFTQHVLQTLTEGGSAKAAVVDKHDRNCLQLAVVHGHLETALAVLQTKLVDINSANRRGLTALHDACTEGHKHIALLLLAMGADVAAKTKDGWTCLMCACSNGHTQLAQLLIAAGCDINISTKLGLTALHIASWKGHTSVVELLIQSGANLLAQANNGKTALQLAQEENQHECATILTAATSKQSEQPVYRIAALEGQLRTCQDKLVQSHRQQDELTKNERLRHEERVANLKVEFGGQLEEASQTISSLKKRISELERCLNKAAIGKSPPDIRLEAPSPTPPPSGSPATTRKRKHKKKNLDMNTQKSPQTAADAGGEESEPAGGHRSLNLNPGESRQKSASTADLRSIPGGDVGNQDEGDGRRNGAGYQSLKLSPDIQRSPEINGGPSKLITQRRLSYAEKTSITTLVEESLRNPASIAAIRKQLKSEGLTPKIQRKFPGMKPNTPTTLPSMPPKDAATTKETSPLTKESNKA